MRYQTINLRELTKSEFILGSHNGDVILDALRSNMKAHSQVIELSLKNIRGIDACFVRNSIASLAKLYCGQIGIVVSHVENIDVEDNLVYGFSAKESPLIIKHSDHAAIAYSSLSSGGRTLLSHVYAKHETSTHQIMKEFDLSAPNASAKLKKLHQSGFLHAEKQTASTGGLEYIYKPFFQCSKLTYELR